MAVDKLLHKEIHRARHNYPYDNASRDLRHEMSFNRFETGVSVAQMCVPGMRRDVTATMGRTRGNRPVSLTHSLMTGAALLLIGAAMAGMLR